MTSASGGILPSYQRLANGGAPASLFARRSFRPREKYLILLVFLTFAVVCFGAFFFLPDFGAGGVAVDSVYRVYRRMQKAGPDLLMPAPPRFSLGDSFNDESYSSHHPNALPMPLGHEAAYNVDVHLIEDRLKLLAKINEEYQQQKTLEKPEIVGSDSRVRTSSFSSSVIVRNEQVFETVPPAPAVKLPLIVGGEDKDEVARERRNKVKEGWYFQPSWWRSDFAILFEIVKVKGFVGSLTLERKVRIERRRHLSQHRHSRKLEDFGRLFHRLLTRNKCNVFNTIVELKLTILWYTKKELWLSYGKMSQDGTSNRILQIFKRIAMVDELTK
ncbi:hypothetical protein M0804_001357 [Polistes exclamans]|nr:hypothetical protein M0804_001357 [Polistes exclamans]